MLAAMLGGLLFQICDLGLQLLNPVVGRRERDAQIGKLAAEVSQPGPVIPQCGIIQNLGHRFGRTALRSLHLRPGIGLV